MGFLIKKKVIFLTQLQSFTGNLIVWKLLLSALYYRQNIYGKSVAKLRILNLTKFFNMTLMIVSVRTQKGYVSMTTLDWSYIVTQMKYLYIARINMVVCSCSLREI